MVIVCCLKSIRAVARFISGLYSFGLSPVGKVPIFCSIDHDLQQPIELRHHGTDIPTAFVLFWSVAGAAVALSGERSFRVLCVFHALCIVMMDSACSYIIQWRSQE